jgi:hypothetical protein
MTQTSRPVRAARSSRMGRLPRFLWICTLLSAALLFALPTTPAAAKTKPCWQRLVDDWWDGRIDNVYPIKCYRAAIRNLPEDAKGYSDAPEDIRRALLAALRDMRGGGGGTAGPGEVPPIPADTEPVAESSSGGFFRELLGRLGPKNADSIPIPLLVLAGIAFLLLGAATASYLARWIQARRLALEGAPATRPATHRQEQT